MIAEKSLKRFYREIRRRVSLLMRMPLHFNEWIIPSYYPEKPQKPKISIVWHYFVYIVRFGWIPHFYLAYGLDCKERRTRDYMSYPSFMHYRDLFNTHAGDFRRIVQDKEQFERFSKENGLLVASSLDVFDRFQKGVIINSAFFPFLDLCTRYPHLFLKPVDSIQGKNTFSIDYEENEFFFNDKPSTIEEIINTISSLNQTILVQPRLKNHSKLDQLYCHSLNTLRVVSVWLNGKCYILGALLRIGASGSIVDNWAYGGVAVGVNDDGSLKKYGFFKPGFGTKTDRHPDSGMVFESFVVPFYREAIELVERAQRVFSCVPTIGWDIAITEEGPLIIEGNDNYDGALLQCCCGGMKKEFLDFYHL